MIFEFNIGALIHFLFKNRCLKNITFSKISKFLKKAGTFEGSNNILSLLFFGKLVVIFDAVLIDVLNFCKIMAMYPALVSPSSLRLCA